MMVGYKGFGHVCEVTWDFATDKCRIDYYV